MEEGKSVKNRLLHEIRLFFIYTLFFAFFLNLFQLYKSLILGEYAINYVRYGYSLFEAVILAKIILLGETLKLGERFQSKPLIYSVMYKTVIFTFFTFIFALFEHFIVGYIRGKDFNFLFQELLNKSLDQILATVLVMSFVYILFFSLVDLSRVIGQKKMFELFFKKRSS